jgi:hypothetical protein
MQLSTNGVGVFDTPNNKSHIERQSISSNLNYNAAAYIPVPAAKQGYFTLFTTLFNVTPSGNTSQDKEPPTLTEANVGSRNVGKNVNDVADGYESDTSSLWEDSDSGDNDDVPVVTNKNK